MSTETSWKKVNQERKLIKKARKKEKLLKQAALVKKLEDIEKEKKLEKFETKLPLSTISIAVPGSILDNAQSPELRAYLAGQIGRSACIFRVNEIIVYDDGDSSKKQNKKLGEEVNISRSCLQLARILQYLECPQYLRKYFFPIHKDLKYSGLLNPLDAPHHLRQHHIFPYREGVVSEKKVKDDKGSFVNVGLINDVLVDKNITPGIRVTVKLCNQNVKKLKGIVVAPTEPTLETGIYWGYTVRVAHSFSKIFGSAPFKNGYDLIIGTSDKGNNINTLESKSLNYNNALIVYGGLHGVEASIENDEKLHNVEPQFLFDHYLNVLPQQGSRTIRTEEAILISLAAIQEKLNPKTIPIENSFKDLIAQSEDTGIKSMET